MVLTKEGRKAVPWRWYAVATALALVSALWAQDTKAPEIPPAQLVRETVQHEVAAANDASVKHMFRARKQTARGSQTKLYVETDDSMVGMVIAINDQPLNQQQKKAEVDHLTWLKDNPEQLRKKRAREKEDTERTLRIVKALPEAFLYQYVGSETGGPGLGKPGDPLLRLKFTANPNYTPPSRLEQVLEGMQGYLLIDATAKRIARIDGTLFRDVSFGWGIIGHLDKGGHFQVQQADVGDGSWNITAMSLKMTGKILLFKGISMISDEVFSDFQRVPDKLTFGKGVEMLKAEQERPSQNGEASASRKPPR
jgi:hypothetical protein